MLERLRGETGLTQEQLGYLAGMTRDTVSRVEHRESRPRMKTLAGLARALSEALGRHIDFMDLYEIPAERQERAS